jgi:hypothetical protein
MSEQGFHKLEWYLQQTGAVKHADYAPYCFQLLRRDIQPHVERLYHLPADFFALVRADVRVRLEDRLR